MAAIPVRPGDLPASWTATAHQDDPHAAAAHAALVKCIGTTNTQAHQIRKVSSPDYDQGNSQITSNAGEYRSAADIATDVAIFHSSKINSCYQQQARTQLTASLPAGGTIRSLRLTITPGANGGPSNVVATGTGTVVLSVNNQTATVHTDVAFIRGRVYEAEVDFTGVGAPVPQPLRTQVIAAIAKRAAAA